MKNQETGRSEESLKTSKLWSEFLQKRLTRRQLLKTAVFGILAGLIAFLPEESAPEVDQEKLQQEHDTAATLVSEAERASKEQQQSSALAQTPSTETKQTATAEATQVRETPSPTENNRDYVFALNGINLEEKFTLLLSPTLNLDNRRQEKAIAITQPTANREKAGWSAEVLAIFQQYWQHPYAAVIVQTDIVGHEAVIIHAFSYQGQLLPGEFFRHPLNRELLPGAELALVQGDKIVKLKVIDVSTVDGEVFAQSDATAYNADGELNPDYPADKLTFFRSDMWQLPDTARLAGQISFVTCDGRNLGDDFSLRLIVTAAVIDE